MGSGKKRSIGTIILAGAMMALAFALAGPATAKTVHHQAKIFYKGAPAYSDGFLVFDYEYTSTNRRCIDHNAITGISIRLLFLPDLEYQQDYDDEGNSGYEFKSGTDYYDMIRLGAGHFRLELPGGQTVATVNPDGSYGGTYPFSRWWAEWSGPPYKSEFNKLIGSNYSHGELGGGSLGPPRWLVYWRKSGGKRVRHVVHCGQPKFTGPFVEELDLPRFRRRLSPGVVRLLFKGVEHAEINQAVPGSVQA